MPILQLASSKISAELMGRLRQFTESSGVNQSAAIRQAIEQFLDNAESTGLAQLTRSEGNFKPSELVARLEAVDCRLLEVEARLQAVERRSSSSPEPIAVVKTASPPEPIAVVKTASPPRPKREPSTGMLGTTEAHQQLQAIGYSKALPTFRRYLATAIGFGELPTDLVALGLVADFEVRRSANPKDNSVRWLRLGPATQALE